MMTRNDFTSITNPLLLLSCHIFWFFFLLIWYCLQRPLTLVIPPLLWSLLFSIHLSGNVLYSWLYHPSGEVFHFISYHPLMMIFTFRSFSENLYFLLFCFLYAIFLVMLASIMGWCGRKGLLTFTLSASWLKMSCLITELFYLLVDTAYIGINVGLASGLST